MEFTKKVAIAMAMGGLCVSGTQAAVTQLEGQAGGGIVPWALLSSGTPTVSSSWVDTGDFTLSSVALQASFANRVELSYAQLAFDTGRHPAHDEKGESIFNKIDLDVVGLKIQALAMDGALPAVTVGLQYKKASGTNDFEKALTKWGADDSGLDFYLAATSVFPIGERKMLLNGTIRGTKGNQMGILGFGSATDDSYEAQFEGSVGIFLHEKSMLGAEYRMKPDNLGRDSEDAWADLFFAYFPNKNMSLVAAAVFLGNIAPSNHYTSGGNDFGHNQRGLYLQIQANF